jgi:hypothetical protein
MIRRFAIGSLAALALGATVAWTPIASHTALVGPPWISIEYPPSPYDGTTRDAYLLVHSFHHGTPMDYGVNGTAEGLVNGARRTIALKFTSTSRTGVQALRKQWPSDGTWMLAISVTQAPGDSVTALVDIGASGDVIAVRVPTERRSNWNLNVPKAVTKADIDAALAARVRVASKQ